MPQPTARRASQPAPAASHRTRLQLEPLEARDVPAGFFLTGVGSSTSPAEPFARIYDSTATGGGSNVVGPGNINAFPGFAGSVRVASGDVNGDFTDDIICAQGTGAGSQSRVRIFDGASALLNKVPNVIADFFVYSNGPGASQTPGFGGGVFVASADFDGDGRAELVTSPGAGASGHIKVFSFGTAGGAFLGSNPTLRSSFFAYPGFLGEIRIATLNTGGVPFLVTASGAGTSQSDVRFYLNPQNIVAAGPQVFVPPAVQIFPFVGYTGGVSVAAGDATGDGNDELFVSKNDGISTVRVFNVAAGAPTATPLPNLEFQAFAGFTGEVRIGAADVDGNGTVEVLTSTGSSPGAGGSHIKAWNLTGGLTAATEARSFFAYQGYIGGVWLSPNDFSFAQTFTSNAVANIPKGVLPNFAIPVDFATLNDSGITNFKGIQLTLNVTHPNLNNLGVSITRGGTSFILFSAGPGPAGSNVNGSNLNVTINDGGASIANTGTPGVALTGLVGPATGTLTATFLGQALAGNWLLDVVDFAANPSGTLNSWSIMFII